MIERKPIINWMLIISRMGGIYGPDEKTILGRAFYFMSQSVGYFAFCQKKDLKIDWLHIDNAVQGHVKVKKQKGTEHFSLFYNLPNLVLRTT